METLISIFILFFSYRIIRRKKSVWVKPGRTDRWWQNLISGKLAEEEWKKNLRMAKHDFHKLVDLIKPFAVERSTRVRKDTIDLSKRVAITLYYLKDQGSMQMTANTFGVARCTVGQIVKEICTILSKHLGPKMIQFPVTKEEVLEGTTNFHKAFGFPQVIGCIDGTHIPIKQPSENAHDFYSYKLCYSINCQAVCDFSGKFINVEVRWPGSVHDARVFANCDIQKGFANGKLKMFYKELLPGEECVPQILIGDPAYPLLPYVMKEFDHCKSNEEVIFNQLLRGARNQIECAFGRLKARWRILTRPIDIPVKDIPNLAFACFVLHNFCENEKVEVDSCVVEQIIQEERCNIKADKLNSYTTPMGSKVRNVICNYFKEYLG